jgi:Tfp pilus assembly protein PilF
MRAHILRNGGRSQHLATAAPAQRVGRRARRACGALAMAALLSVCPAAPRGEISWRDIESRIQYGYYTEDARALRGLQDTLSADESSDRLHGYYAALLAWRLAQLAAHSPAAGQGESAAQLTQRCVSNADLLLAAQADFAEALALRAACRATPTDANGSQGSFAVHRARRDLERALRLTAHNPRVLLVDAMNDYQLTPGLGGNRERALVKLRGAVAAFEAERADAEQLPGWGAAEAYLLLGRDLLDHGEAVGARDALEHALLIAPEFAQARRLMAQITGG